jgi:hypothetical protein
MLEDKMKKWQYALHVIMSAYSNIPTNVALQGRM